jgi:integrase/recombinase XerD
MKQYTHPFYQKEIDAFSNFLRLKNFSNLNTYTGYMGILIKFLYALDCHLDDVTKGGFEYYLLNNNWGQSHQRQVHGCLGNFFTVVMKKPEIVQYVPFATKEEKLPDVYSIEEIQRLINACNNNKHKLLILLQYDCGNRVGELVDMELAHLDLDRNGIKIVQAKGKKDRYCFFSDTTKELIEQYLEEYKPKKYLFEGQHGDKYTVRSLQQVNITAKNKAGIKKKGATHILRHSFATHLLEGGSDIKIIGHRLGHSYNSKATAIYARISRPVLQKQVCPGSAINL